MVSVRLIRTVTNSPILEGFQFMPLLTDLAEVLIGE